MPQDIELLKAVHNLRKQVKNYSHENYSLASQLEDAEVDLESEKERNRKLTRIAGDWRFHADPFREWYRREIEC